MPPLYREVARLEKVVIDYQEDLGDRIREVFTVVRKDIEAANMMEWNFENQAPETTDLALWELPLSDMLVAYYGNSMCAYFDITFGPRTEQWKSLGTLRQLVTWCSLNPTSVSSIPIVAVGSLAGAYYAPYAYRVSKGVLGIDWTPLDISQLMSGEWLFLIDDGKREIEEYRRRERERKRRRRRPPE